MRKITFDEEELFAIAVFSPDTRANTADMMESVLPELEDDEDMHAIVLSAKEKLRRITDEEYARLGLEEYREELASTDEDGDESGDNDSYAGSGMDKGKAAAEGSPAAGNSSGSADDAHRSPAKEAEK